MPSQSLPSSAKPAMVNVLRWAQVFLTQALSPRGLAAVAHLGDGAFKADLAGVRERLFAVHLEAFAELDVGPVDNILQMRFALD